MNINIISTSAFARYKERLNQITGKKYTTAINLLKTAEELNRYNPELFYILANGFFVMCDYTEAIKCLSYSITLTQNRWYYYYYRGRLYKHLREYKNALYDFTSAIQLSLNNPKIFMQRSQVYTAVGLSQQADNDIKMHNILMRRIKHDKYFLKKL